MTLVPLARTLLGPVLLAQAASIRRHALRLPEPAGPRSGHVVPAAVPAPGNAKGSARAAGPQEPGPALRLLVVGDSSAAGVGVEHQSEALAAPLAASLAHALGQPVHWQLVARSGVDSRLALDLIREVPCDAADVVVVVLGVNDVTRQRAPARFAQDYRHVLRHLEQATGAHTWVLTGLPPIQNFPALPQPLRWYTGQCARRLDARLHALCATNPAWNFLSLAALPVMDAMAPDGFHPGALLYRRCAQLIATRVAKLLGQPRADVLEA